MKFSKEEIQTACKHLVTRIRNFLQSPQCREFLLFLFFVFIASAFWILHTLNEEYETEVSIPLRFKNVPENVVFTSDIPQNLNLKVSDKGTVLVKYMLGQGLMPITLDFDEFRQKGTHIRQLTSEWEKKIQSQLVVSTRIKDISPDTLEIIYTQGQGKRVPVRIQGTPTTKRQYYLAGQDILPDSVMVYAPKSLLNTINAAYTQEADLTDIADTTHFTLPCQGSQVYPRQRERTLLCRHPYRKNGKRPHHRPSLPGRKTIEDLPRQGEHHLPGRYATIQRDYSRRLHRRRLLRISAKQPLKRPLRIEAHRLTRRSQPHPPLVHKCRVPH